jgi:hypothetical protein
MAPIVAIDIETDGLHPGRRVWEVAMIRRDHIRLDDGRSGWNETQIQFFVGLDLANSDPHGLQVGGYWDRHPAGRKISGKPPLPGCEQPPMSKHAAAGEVMKWTFGAHLVGVNPSFDADTLARMLRSEGYLASWHYHLVDVLPMAVGWLNARRSVEDYGAVDPRIPVTPPWKSDDLSMMCGVETPGSDRHTALADARWALRWYDAITGGAQ